MNTRKLGFKVYVLDDPEQIEGYLMKYEPHDYQKYAIRYIEEHPLAQFCLIWALAKRASRFLQLPTCCLTASRF